MHIAVEQVVDFLDTIPPAYVYSSFLRSRDLYRPTNRTRKRLSRRPKHDDCGTKALTSVDDAQPILSSGNEEVLLVDDSQCNPMNRGRKLIDRSNLFQKEVLIVEKQETTR